MITIKIRCAFSVLINSIILTNDRPADVWGFLQSGNGVLTNAYSKLYYRGGGWYAISGYTWNGSDVKPLIDLINELKSANAVMKEGGYYFDETGEICGVYNTEACPCEPTPDEEFVF